MSERDQWREYDLAASDLLLLISYYSEIIFEEQGKGLPDMKKIVEWKNERRVLERSRRELDIQDQAAIAHIRAKYGPLAHATLQKQKP